MLLALLLTLAHAKESWLCTEEASQRMGESIYACGIGIAASEQDARAKALESASSEFKQVCDLTDSCRGHEVTADPKRTTCEQSAGQFKCYRGVLFTAGAIKAKVQASQPAASVNPKLATKKIKTFPRLRVGMTMQALLAELGEPESARKGPDRSTIMRFKAPKPICNSITGDTCMVAVMNGVVSLIGDEWNYRATDILEH